MLTRAIVTEIRNAARTMNDRDLVAYVKQVTKTVGCRYGTLWSTLFGRNWPGPDALPDPYPDIEPWGAWYDKILEHYDLSPARQLAAIRALRERRA